MKIFLFCMAVALFSSFTAASECEEELYIFDGRYNKTIKTYVKYKWAKQYLPHKLGICQASYFSYDSNRIIKTEKTSIKCCKKNKSVGLYLLPEPFNQGCYLADTKTKGKKFVIKEPMVLCKSLLEEKIVCKQQHNSSIFSSLYSLIEYFLPKRSLFKKNGRWLVDSETKGSLYAKYIEPIANCDCLNHQ